MEPDWIEHRRADDREHVGWMKPVDDGFVAIDLLGRPRTDVVDWLSAEETLDELGLRYLADPHELLLDDGAWLRVRIAEVTPSVVRVKKEDWGDMTALRRSTSRCPTPSRKISCARCSPNPRQPR